METETRLPRKGEIWAYSRTGGGSRWRILEDARIVTCGLRISIQNIDSGETQRDYMFAPLGEFADSQWTLVKGRPECPGCNQFRPDEDFFDYLCYSCRFGS